MTYMFVHHLHLSILLLHLNLVLSYLKVVTAPRFVMTPDFYFFEQFSGFIDFKIIV